MRHCGWISASQLDQWARSNNARGQLPKLIRLLVHGTTELSDLEHIDFPGEEQIHRPGYDGETKSHQGNAWVPSGIAYWELTAGGEGRQKFDEDYSKRITNRGSGDFGQVTYVALTARHYRQKKKWVEEKCKRREWKEVRLYDSDDLEQWLEMAPPVALWLSRNLSIPLDGMSDLSTHWDNIQASLKRQLPPSILLVGRQDAAAQFKSWLSGSPEVLTVLGQSPQEVVDVFTAWVESLPVHEQSSIASRVIIVENTDLWRTLADWKRRLILICAQRLEVDEALVKEAHRKGHHVLLPVPSVRGRDDKVVRLERMNRAELAEALMKANLSEHEARSLAQQSGGSFTVLRRRFSSVALISTPNWAQGHEAEELAPLLLAGAWQDSCTGDQAILSKLAGVPYPAARRIVNRWRCEADAPVRWANGAWEFVSPVDAWTFLQPTLSPDRLDVWESATQEVLGVNDPRLELPPEERWKAAIHGKQFPHSEDLRRGLTGTLALLATSDVASQDTDPVSLQARVSRVVRGILPGDATWHRWASLGHLLPTIAEAAPEDFLNSVESGLRGEHPELPKLFAEEQGGFAGRAEHSGLLWALDRLAWSGEYLSRVSIVLARLAEHDPGGPWLNRPKASLRDIFFSWMPHTSASLDERLDVLRLLACKHPRIAWRLLLDLLPHRSESVMHHHTPEWRFWAEGWKRLVTIADYSRTVSTIIAMVLAAAKETPEKWLDLVGDFPSFPQAYLKRALEALNQSASTALTGDLRRRLWLLVRDVAQRERYLRSKGQEGRAELIEGLEAVRDKLQPTDPVEVAVPLFRHGVEALGDGSLSWEQQHEQRRERRMQVVRDISNDLGFDSILRLARRAGDVWAVGITLAEATDLQYEPQIIPNLLCSAEKPLEQFAMAFAMHCVHRAGREWAEAHPIKAWAPTQAAAFASVMPFDQRTWNFVAGLGESISTEYWRRVQNFTPGLSARETEFAAKSLIAIGRPSSAIDLLATSIEGNGKPANCVLIDLLEAALKTPRRPEDANMLDSYHLQIVIHKLQEASDVDENRLARLEWSLLPMLDELLFSPAVLHRLLSRDWSFFIEVLSLLYRPHHAPRPQSSQLEPEPDELTRRQAERGWHLLRGWHRLPGTKADGTVDAALFRAWVKSARERAAQVDRLEACDLTLGELFALAPREPDGTWPSILVRDVIDEVESPALEQGFAIGVFNKRGVVTKSLGEGGGQERELAAQYETYAKAHLNRWPRTAAVLMRIVADYREQARREDSRVERG